MSNLKVKFHGILASNRDHSCIEVDYQDTHLLIQPTKKIEGINAVVVCDIDPDEWSQWKYYADNDVPIYSTLGVKHYIPDEQLRKVIKVMGNDFKVGNLKILPEKTPVAPHEPMIGLRFPQFRVAILPELPPYLGQQLIKDISLPPHHLIAGIGSYSKPDHKINFINFADRILACKEHKGLLSITLTNFRLDLLRRKDEVLKRLRKDWDIPILFAKKGMVLTFTRDGKLIKGDQIKSKLHLEEFRSTGVDYDLKHPETRWREIMADVRYLGNSAFPRLLKGEKWGDWTLEDVEKYFAKCIDTLRSVGFIIPEKHDNSSFWKLYWRCKKKGLIKSSPPKTKEEKEEWDRKRDRILKKALVATYFSKSKPAYRCDIDLIESDLKHLGWDKKDLLIDSKADGLRVTALKLKGKGYVFVDPADVKYKSPNVSSRLPEIVRELETNLPDGTVLDAEFIAMVGNEVIHRTDANSILNSKEDAEKLAPFAYIFVFDVLFYKGKDLRNLPLSERLKYLNKIKDSEHIIIERPSHVIEAGHPAFYVRGSDFKGIHRAWNIITKDKGLRRHGKFVKYLAEGVMIKTLDGVYQVPQNKGWCLKGGSYILTEYGFMMIQDIVPGIRVFSKDGKLHKVIRVFKRKQGTDKVIDLMTHKSPKVRLTKDHLVLSKNGWVEAQNLKQDDIQQFIPRETIQEDAPDTLTLEIYGYKKEIKCDPLFWKFIGFTLAEGQILNNSSKHVRFNHSSGASGIRIEINPKVTETDWVIDAIESRLRIKPKIYIYGEQDKIIEFKDPPFAKWFYKTFVINHGKGIYNKGFKKAVSIRLPFWFVNLPDDSWYAFLEGYWLGDGTRERKWRISTSSSYMAGTLYIIARMRGHEGVSVNYQKTSRHDNWRIYIPEKVTKWSNHIYLTKVPQYKVHNGEDYLYDIEIEGEDSFTNGQLIFHNSKVKKFHELDCVILDKKLVKGAKKTWNYLLGIDIPKEYAKVLASMSKKSWYDSAGVLVGKQLYRGKEILDRNGRWVMVMTKTDNTNIQGEIGDILRIAAEEVIKYENEERPDYPRYSFYIGRPLELVPEKNVSDSLQVLERLSLLEPKRMSIEDLLHIRGEKLPKELKRVAEKVKALSDNQLWELRKYLHEG